jgi:hypothetical protein
MIVTVRSLSAGALVVLAALLVSACEDTTPTSDERLAVETAVRSYLEAKAEAYSTLNLEPLEGIASPNEILAVRKLLTQLAQTGDRIDSALIGFEIDDMSIFRGINATVRLIEVWDVTRYDAFTGREKGRNPSSLQNSIIQLRLIDGRWVVVGWSLLKVESPTDADHPEPVFEGEGGV